MNYAQSFDEFAASLGPTDIALYAGAAIVAWVLLKDKINPLTALVQSLLSKFTGSTTTKPVSGGVTPAISAPNNVKEDVFFELIASWKQTRDLAVKAGCSEAIKVADEMFPFLSPNVCNKESA